MPVSKLCCYYLVFTLWLITHIIKCTINKKDRCRCNVNLFAESSFIVLYKQECPMACSKEPQAILLIRQAKSSSDLLSIY